MRCSNILLAASALLSTASCAAVSKRATNDDAFKLYAYGTGLGGAQMFYYNGAAHMGAMENLPSNASAYNVTFSNSDNVWTVTPDDSSAPFTNATFYVPSPDNSTSTSVGFLTSGSAEPTDIVTSGWMFYGHLVILETEPGAWETLFYAKTTDYDSVWSLHWNVTDDDTAIPLAVKNSAPSTE